MDVRRRALVPEDLPRIHSQVTRSVARALAAIALTAPRNRSATRLVTQTWPRDQDAELFARAATSPVSTTDAGALSPTVTSSFLAGLAPGSAAVKLFARSLQLDFAGVHQFSVPRGVATPLPIFVAEGAPHPVVDGSTNAAVVGPVKKILIGAGITEELQNATPETATTIIGRVLSEAAAKSLDVYVFDNAAGDAVRPAGLLNGVAPLPPTAGGGTSAMAKDLANIAGAMSDAGISAENMVVIANPRQAITLRLLSGPNFTHPIFSTVGLAAGTVVGVEAAAIASGFDGAPEIEIGRGGLLHFADTQPQQIGTPGSPAVVAAPARSPFQEALLVLKLRLNLAWASCMPGAVQAVTNVTW
jgi:hypothetical protein